MAAGFYDLAAFVLGWKSAPVSDLVSGPWRIPVLQAAISGAEAAQGRVGGAEAAQAAIGGPEAAQGVGE